MSPTFGNEMTIYLKRGDKAHWVAIELKGLEKDYRTKPFDFVAKAYLQPAMAYLFNMDAEARKAPRAKRQKLLSKANGK